VRKEDQDAKGKKIKRSYRNCWFEVSSAIQIIKFRLMEFLIIFSITQIKADRDASTHFDGQRCFTTLAGFDERNGRYFIPALKVF